MTRPVYLLLGWLFFALGAVGVLLPALPTTPFMLLALWAFSNSSQRFHDWLYTHKLFGPPLQQWCEHRVIPLAAKIIAIVFMVLSLAYLIVYSTLPIWLIGIIALIMLSAALFILTKPSTAPTQTKK